MKTCGLLLVISICLLNAFGLRLPANRIAGQFVESPSIVILHGLLGSSRSVAGWAKELYCKLEEDYNVLSMDLRNHGQSYTTSGQQLDMSYPAMATDVLETLQSMGIHRCHLVGHSMGGKVAAVCSSLAKSQSVLSLTMLDISPIEYGFDDLPSVVESIQKLRTITQQWQGLSKSQLHELVRDQFPGRALSTFIQSNIAARQSDWSWAFDLDAIERNLPHILSFPSLSPVDHVPMLLVKGSNSNFVRSHHTTQVKALFPNFALTTVRDAGHWLHIEQPLTTAEKVASFVSQSVTFHSQRGSGPFKYEPPHLD